ncbi:hypothetical protein [Spiroplasma endosymbiont of Virgichneumon dumeticola]|uniref:hypothetical protein n=1 Tax=Spiroplasma endosymbiont of Virgichneumon dumeticola TaxID=3139323 RepID=UPI0035C8C8C8
MEHTNGYDNYYAIPTVFSGMINIANQIIPSCLKKTENLKCDYQNESDNHDFDANEINNDENIPMNPISVTKSTIL